ncbi:MAG: T9SS type A sorting domain-containing protein [Ignavibacteria bacterium]|nr:T9SS type A sorting domain-containing protein [Ignavibacteria bacterium]
MRTKIIPNVLVLLIFNLVICFSQPSRDTLARVWNAIPSPNPSIIKAITFDSSDVMYIGVWGEGVYRSLNLGQNWTLVSSGLTNPYITSIEIDSLGRIFASTYGGGVFVSTNNGALWTQVNTGLPSLKIRALKVKYPSIIFVAVEGYGIYRSTNSGSSWVAVNKGLGFYTVNCFTIANNGGVLAGTDGDGIYYSTDNGNNWTKSGYASNFRVITSFAKTGLGEILCGTYQGGVFISENNGLNWTVFKANDTLKNVTAVTYFNNEEPIAGTDRIGVLRYDSRNAEDWQLTNLRELGISALGRSRTGQLFAGASDGSLYRSTNGGVSWTVLRSASLISIEAFHSYGNYLFVSLTNGRSYRSSDQGLTWTEMDMGNTRVRFFTNDSTGRILALGSRIDTAAGRLLVSTDQGTTWATLLEKRDTMFVTIGTRNNLFFLGIGFRPANPQNPNSPSSDVLRSTDAGSTWTALGVRAKTSSGISFIGFNSNGNVYISLTDSVIKSTNNGNSWSIALGKSSNFYRSIGFTRSGTVFVTADMALYISTNEGASWSIKYVSPQNQFLQPIVVTPFDQILLGSTMGGILTSINSGSSWDSTHIYYGFLREIVSMLKADNQGYIWLVSSKSIYRTIDPNAFSRVELISPPQNARGVPIKLDFIWKHLPKAEMYEFELSDYDDFSMVREKIVFYDTIWANKYLLKYYTLYFWRVRPRLNNALGNWSPTFTFTTIIKSPTLVAPLNQQHALGLRPTFIWMKSEGATGYILQVSKDSNFSNFVINRTFTNVNDTSYIHNSDLEYYTEYYWRVAGRVGTAQSEWSEVWKFKTKIQAPVLRSPANRTYGVPTITTLRWNQVKGGISYEVQIALDQNFEYKFFDGLSQANDQFETKLLEHFTKYYWRIRASDEHGSSDWSEVWWFITIIQAPELLSPYDKQENIKAPLLLKWGDFAQATHHHIQISTTPDFTNFVVNDSTLRTNSYSLKDLLPNKTYYWRVRYKVDQYIGLWSETRSFSTSIGVPQLVYPPNDTTDMPLYVNFIWDLVAGAEWYEFVLSLDPNFTSDIIARETKLNTTQYLVSGLSYQTTYYWKVRGLTQNGNGDWSETWKFRTRQQPATVPDDFSNIQIFPNPFDDFLYVKISNGVRKIEIRDVLGRSIFITALDNFSNGEIKLNLKSFESGIYFIIFENVIGSKIFKVIKN